MNREIKIPSHIQIETVAGYCNVRCIMCPIEKSIRKEIMSNEFFESIVQRLLPIKEEIKIFTILGLGETLLDKGVVEKVRIAKKYGFKEIGIFSNGMALEKNLSIELLNAGLDVFIFSLDGFSKEVEESIRIGSNLDIIVKNITDLIEQRNIIDSKARIILRFTVQEKNEHDWENFLSFWSTKLRQRDAIYQYGLHNVGHVVENEIDKSIKNIKCSEIYNRMIIFSDGNVGLCCADQFGHYNIGNILETDPIEIYNHELFKYYREEMDKGNMQNLELCKDCTVAYSIINSKHIFIE
jgi:radical SAM protein with 4Fe4S-binding SPASM domain